MNPFKNHYPKACNQHNVISMPYNENDIKSYCGNCKQEFDAEVYYCPNCGSNLVNYNTGLPTEKFAVQDRWERHNRDFKKDKEQAKQDKG